MARRTRLSRPPRTENPELDRWLGQVYSEVNNLPNFSLVSLGNVSDSNYTGQVGDIAIDVGQGHMWIKHDDSTSTEYWDPFATAGYGMLYLEDDNTTALAVTTSAHSIVPAIYVESIAGAVSGVTGNNAMFTVNSEGTYHFAFASSFSADVNTTWDFDLFKNGSSTSFGFQRKIGASADVGSGGFQAICPATSGDTFTVQVEHDAGSTKGLTIIYSQFLIDKLL